MSVMEKMKAQDCLIEIGCEEMPPKQYKKLLENFKEAVSKGLQAAELSFDLYPDSFVTPRRLALCIKSLASHQPDRVLLKRGPAKAAAFDSEGKPSKAALGFAESCGVPFETLSINETDKGAWLVYEQTEIGKSVEQLIPNIIENALMTLPMPKRMRWGNNDYSFVRPIHWILMLYGEQVIPAKLFGLGSGGYTYGHRFHHPEKIKITSLQSYQDTLLKTGFVMANSVDRHGKIVTEINKLNEQHAFKTIIDHDLLNEVTGLVEWPVALLGEFDPAFLDVPREVLISSMQVHQKCFPIEDLKGSLLPKYVIISNIESKDPAVVIAGNNRVMHARLADAAFFFRVDKEIPLHQRQEGLKHVVYQAGLGSLWDKSHRIAHLAKIIAREIKADPTYAERAALLCKTDLLTQMVGEFPELQGIMGRYYALHDAEPEAVALAIEQHYYPRSAQDNIELAALVPEGCAVAIADRLDSLVGVFGLGKRPTGDKDPFGLRRQALGVLRIIIEKSLDLDLQTLLEAAYKNYQIVLPEKNVVQSLLDFCFERFRTWSQDRGISTKVFDAVLAKRPTNPLDFYHRLLAVNTFQSLPEAAALAAANKRVQNILNKSDVVFEPNEPLDPSLLNLPAEKELAKLVAEKEKEIRPLIEAKNYQQALKILAALREPVDQFFTDVMVMDKDEKIRDNRLKLLTRLRALFLKIADISVL